MKGIMMTGFFQNFSDAFYKAVIKDQRYLAYLDGLKITILISIFAILIGIAIGLLVAVVKVSAVQRKELWIFNKICNISPICFTHYFIMASTENNQYLIVRLFQQITDFQTIYVFHLYV